MSSELFSADVSVPGRSGSLIWPGAGNGTLSCSERVAASCNTGVGIGGGVQGIVPSGSGVGDGDGLNKGAGDDSGAAGFNGGSGVGMAVDGLSSGSGVGSGGRVAVVGVGSGVIAGLGVGVVPGNGMF